jgi:hypothetical protein
MKCDLHTLLGGDVGIDGGVTVVLSVVTSGCLVVEIPVDRELLSTARFATFTGADFTPSQKVEKSCNTVALHIKNCIVTNKSYQIIMIIMVRVRILITYCCYYQYYNHCCCYHLLFIYFISFILVITYTITSISGSLYIYILYIYITVTNH